MSQPSMPSKSLLPGSWDCPAIFRSRLGDQAGRQRLMEADGHLLLVLHAPPQPDQDAREGRFFWRHPDGTWSSSHQGSGPQAIMRLLSEYEKDMEQFDLKEQSAKSARDYFDLLTATTPLARAAVNLHVVLQEARKACSEDRHLILSRDKAYEIMRRGEILSSDIKYGLEYAIAYRSEQQAINSQHMAHSAHRLNVLAAFFFPIATLSAIFGVNLKTGIEQASPPWLFLGLIFTGLIIGAVLSKLVIVRPREA